MNLETLTRSAAANKHLIDGLRSAIRTYLKEQFPDHSIAPITGTLNIEKLEPIGHGLQMRMSFQITPTDKKVVP